MSNDYQDKKQRRIERYKELADKNDKRSEELFEQSRKTTEHIPMGQPILVGHHSEARHRSTLDKSWNELGRAVESSKRAEYYRGKAEAAENSNTISSDDPEAVKKLKLKLALLLKGQEMMKGANAIIRHKTMDEGLKLEKLCELGYSEKDAHEIMYPRHSHLSPGFASYALSNNNANINRVKRRIEKLKEQASQTTSERVQHGIRIVDNIEDNRLQLFFDGKPEADVRAKLKSNRFRWSGRNGCWQAYRSAIGYRLNSFLSWYQQNHS